MVFCMYVVIVRSLRHCTKAGLILFVLAADVLLLLEDGVSCHSASLPHWITYFHTYAVIMTASVYVCLLVFSLLLFLFLILLAV